MKVHHLDCATMCPLGGARLNGVERLVGHCLLLEGPRSLVLVDTGIGTHAVPLGFRLLAGPDLRPERTAHAQVKALGFDPADVRDVILTHLDVDHAGGIVDFPAARIHVQGAEHDHATRRPGLRPKLRYHGSQWAHETRWVLHPPEQGEAWRGFGAVRALDGLPPEVLLVPLGGHSRGHQAVAIDLGGRWLLHAGDLYAHRGRMTDAGDIPFGLAAFERAIADDFPLVVANQARVRELRRAHADVTVFSAHDADEYAALAAPR